MSGQPGTDLPQARSTDLVTERVGDELVTYDKQTLEAHCLTPVAAAVFQAADGKNSREAIAMIVAAQLARPTDLDDVDRALAELDECALLVTDEPHRISRRALMRGGAALGSAVLAGSLISTVATPAYANVPSFDTGSFSGMQILVTLTDKSTYGAKWGTGGTEATLTRSPTSGVCGTGSAANSFCGVTPSEAGCLTGTGNTELSAQATPATGTVTGVQVNLPALPSGAYSSVTMYMFCGHGNTKTCTVTQTFTLSGSASTSKTFTSLAGCFS